MRTPQKKFLLREFPTAHAGMYNDISPVELSRRIGLPREIDRYLGDGYDEYLSGQTLDMLYASLEAIQGWKVITTKHDGTARGDIRFFRKNY